MANIITAQEVFDYMGSATDVQDNTDTIDMIDDLVTQKQKELAVTIGRTIDEPYDATAEMFRTGLNCTLYGDRLYFKNIYRDILAITEVKEGDQVLTKVDNTHRDNDYLIDTNKGLLVRNYSVWDDSDFIMITGKFGYLDNDGQGNYTPKAEIKTILKEMVAVASRLWRTYVESDDGSKFSTVRNDISKSTKDLIDKITARPI